MSNEGFFDLSINKCSVLPLTAYIHKNQTTLASTKQLGCGSAYLLTIICVTDVRFVGPSLHLASPRLHWSSGWPTYEPLKSSLTVTSIRVTLSCIQQYNDNEQVRTYRDTISRSTWYGTERLFQVCTVLWLQIKQRRAWQRRRCLRREYGWSQCSAHHGHRHCSISVSMWQTPPYTNL